MNEYKKQMVVIVNELNNHCPVDIIADEKGIAIDSGMVFMMMKRRLVEHTLES